MSKDIRESVDSLREIMPRLNAKVDQAARIIAAADQVLEELGVGFTATSDHFQGRIDMDAEPDDVGCRPVIFLYLAYGRIGGRYKIHVLETVEKQNGLDSTGPTWDVRSESRSAWSTWPREVKLAAFGKLPDLMRAIVARATQAEAEAGTAFTEAEAIMEALLANIPESPRVTRNRNLWNQRAANYAEGKASDPPHGVVGGVGPSNTRSHCYAFGFTAGRDAEADIAHVRRMMEQHGVKEAGFGKTEDDEVWAIAAETHDLKQMSSFLAPLFGS